MFIYSIISTLLENRGLRDYNIKLQKEEVEANIISMRQAIGIDETDIIRIPALFKTDLRYHLLGGEVHCGTNVAYKPGD